MKIIKKTTLLFLASTLFSIPTLSLAHLPTSTNTTTTIAPMLTKATPAVVNISVEKIIMTPKTNGPKGPSITKAIAVGSGVVIDAKKGYIITNAHIVKDQRVMLVTLKDGRRYHAKLIGEADGFDVAVIQIPAKHLTDMPIANSSLLKVGDYVVAIGSPFGLSQTVTSGVVSALNRATPKIEGFQNFIQTDASINPGNSGGALIDLQGQLVGMNTAILAPSAGNIGIGFAIPSNMLKDVSHQLIKFGKVKPSLLGVVAQNLTAELADAMNLKSKKGVLITQVLQGGPADQAGVRSEDIITKVNDNYIHSSTQLHNLMGIIPPGKKLHLCVMREGKSLSLTATTGDPKAKMKQRIIPFLSGMRLKNFSDLEANGSKVTGTIVLDLSDASAGALAGLIPGDIIVKANNKNVLSVDNLISLAEHNKDKLLLKVMRGSQNLFVVIHSDQ